MEALRLIRATVHLEDPTVEHVHASSQRVKELARHQGAFEAKWRAMTHCADPEKGTPNRANLKWVQDKAVESGAVEAACCLCMSGEIDVRLEAWHLLSDLLYRANPTAKARILQSASNLEGLAEGAVIVMENAISVLTWYRRGRKELERMMASRKPDTSEGGVRPGTPLPPQYDALGTGGEVSVCLKVLKHLLTGRFYPSDDEGCVLRRGGGVVDGVGRLLLRLESVMVEALSLQDPGPFRLAVLCCDVVSASVAGSCAEGLAVFAEATVDGNIHLLMRAVGRCFVALPYRWQVKVAGRGAEGGINGALCRYRTSLCRLCLSLGDAEAGMITASDLASHIVRVGRLLGVEPAPARVPVDDPEWERKPSQAGAERKVLAKEAKEGRDKDDEGVEVVSHDEEVAVGLFMTPDPTLQGVGLADEEGKALLEEELVAAYALVRRLADVGGAVSSAGRALKKLAVEHQWLTTFAESRIRSVDIVGPRGRVSRVHFATPHHLLELWLTASVAKAHNLSLQLAATQPDAVVRAQALVERIMEEITGFQVYRCLPGWRGTLSTLTVHRGFLGLAPRSISAIAAVMIVACYAVPTDQFGVPSAAGPSWQASSALASASSRWDDDAGWRYAPWCRTLLRLLAALHLLATLASSCQFFAAEWPKMMVHVCTIERLRRFRRAQKVQFHRTDLPRSGAHYLLKVPPRPTLDAVSLDAWMVMRLLICSAVPYYTILLLLFSFLAFASSPLYLLFHLADFLRGKTASHLAEAASLGLPLLLRTAAFALATLTALGLYAFTYLPTAIHGSTEAQCESPWQCVAMLVLNALSRGTAGLSYDDDGFGMTPLGISGEPALQHGGLFTVVFILLWGYLLQGSLYAQIIDAFANVRQRKAAIESLRSSRCLVCGAQRAQYAEHEGGFERHVTDHHAPASYLAYFAYVSVRDSRMLTAIEAHTLSLLREGRGHELLPVLLPPRDAAQH